MNTMKASAGAAPRGGDRVVEQPCLPAAIHSVLQSITLLYERPSAQKLTSRAELSPTNGTQAAQPDGTILYDTQEWGALPLGFLHDSAVGLAEIQLAAAQEAQNDLTTRVRWVFLIQKKLQSMQQHLESVEKELSTMENDTAQALTKTESLSQALADVAAKEKATTDFVAVVRQRTQPFDRADALEATLVPDAYSYALTMAANIVALGHEASESLLGTGDQKSVPTSDKAGLPTGLNAEKHTVDGLHMMLTTLDEAHSYFSLHLDFVESAEYLRKTETLRLNLLLGVRQAIRRILERCEQRALGWRERNLSNSMSNGFLRRSHLGLLEVATVPLHQHRVAVSATTTLYERFRVTGKDIRPLIEVIHFKAQADGNVVYTSVLDALEGTYISMRLRLITDALRHDLNTILEENSERNTSTSSNCATEAHMSQSGSLALRGDAHLMNAEEVEGDRCAATLLALRRAVAYCILAAQWEVDTFFSVFVDRQPKTSLYKLIASLGDVLLEVFRPLVLQKNELEELRDILEALTPDNSIIKSEEPKVLPPSPSHQVSLIKNHLPSYSSLGRDPDFHTEKDRSYQYRVLTPLFDRFHRLHQDVQERLIFKAEAFVFHSIRGFEPTDCDLNYPFLLFADGAGPPAAFSYKMTPPLRDYCPGIQNSGTQPSPTERDSSSRSSTITQSIQGADNITDMVEDNSMAKRHDTSGETSQDAETRQENVAADDGSGKRMSLLKEFSEQSAAFEPLFVVTLGEKGAWYCAVQNTIRLLSATAGVIAPSAFKSLCQHGVEACLTSIFDAAEHIRKIRQECAAGGFHQSLFLIKHLLILKEYLACFQWNRNFLEQYEDDFDDGLRSLDTGKKTAFGLQLKELLRPSVESGSKRVLKNKPADVTRQLDVVLKQQCEMFISQGSATTLFPLLKLSATIGEAQRHRQTPPSHVGAAPSLSQNLSLQQLSEFVAEFKESVRWTVPRLLFFLYIYLPPAVSPEEAVFTSIEPAFEDSEPPSPYGPVTLENAVRMPFFGVPDDKVLTEMREVSLTDTAAKPGSFPRASDILSAGLRNSINDAIKRIETSLLQRLSNSETDISNVEQLRKTLNWWSSSDFTDRFDCMVRQYEEWMRNQRTQSGHNLC